MKKQISVFMTLSVAASMLCACGSEPSEAPKSAEATTAVMEAVTEATTVTTTTEAPKSAIESLEPNGEHVYEGLLAAADSFKSPTSLRLLEISPTGAGDDSTFVKVSGTNSMGGTVTQYGFLQLERDDSYASFGLVMDKGYILEVEDADITSDHLDLFMDNKPGADNYVDIGRINNALQEYWESRGMH